MLAPILSVLAALASGEQLEEAERRRREALGLGGEEEGPPPGLGPAFVPVRIWRGLAVWRVVHRRGLEALDREICGLEWQDLFDNDEEYVLDDLDPKNFAPGGQFKTGAIADEDTYALTNSDGELLGVLVVGVGKTSRGNINFQIKRGELFDRQDQARILSLVWDLYPEHSENVEQIPIEFFVMSPELERAKAVLEQALASDGLGTKEIADAVRKLPENPGLTFAAKRWAEVQLELLEQTQELEISSSAHRETVNMRLGEWVEREIELGNMTREKIEDMALDWTGQTREEAEKDGGLEELVSKYISREPNKLRAWKEGDESDGASTVSGNIGGMRNAIDMERRRAENAVPDLDTALEHSAEWNRIEIEIRRPPGDEALDVLEIDFDEQYGDARWELRDRRSRGIGLVENLVSAKLLLTREQIRELAGEPQWSFPGAPSDAWQVLDVLGIYTITGGEPMPFFLQVAADHGLADPGVVSEWAPALAQLGDPTDELRRLERIPSEDQSP